jgi:hypothetical protein
MRFISFCGLVLIILSACKPRRSTVVDIDNIPVVEARDIIDTTDYYLVPLETSDRSLIGYIDKVVTGKERIFIKTKDVFGRENLTGALLVFDRSGVFLCQIGSRGRGPGEYIELKGFDIDEETQTVHILDGDNNKVLVYTYDGTFVREVNLDRNEAQAHDIACLDGRYVFWNRHPQPIIEEISVTDMQGKALHKYLPRASQEYSMVPMGMPYFCKINGEVWFVPMCDDRIYKIDSKGNLKQTGELGIKSVLFPLETPMADVIGVTKGKQGLAPVTELKVNAQGKYWASTFKPGSIGISLMGGVRNKEVTIRTITHTSTILPDVSFGMGAIGVDGDHFIGYLDPLDALRSYPDKLAGHDLKEDSNPVLVFFKYLPGAFE